MNQRIKELITQAGGHWNHGDFNMPSSVEFQEQDIEKFAELIVRECIAKVEMRKKFAIEDEHIVDHAFDLLVYDLESHFGVEE